MFSQVRYAARDAMSAICILMKLVELKNIKRKGQLSEADVGKWVASFCQGMVDIKYSEKSHALKVNCHIYYDHRISRVMHFSLVSMPGSVIF